jgi:single-stranded-DNA-specific exonuclease
LKKEKKNRVIIVGNPAWRPGILGLVASRISEEYEKPTFVWGSSEEGERLKGSCRSDGSVNVVNLMQESSHLLNSYGGHELAGGFEITKTNLFDLETTLIDAYNKIRNLKNEELAHEFDYELLLSDVSTDIHNALRTLSPYGLGNPRPTFFFRSVKVEAIRQFGKHKEHLEVIFKEKEKKIIGISFFTTKESFKIPLEPNAITSVLGFIESSTFMGRTNIRLRIIDIV